MSTWYVTYNSSDDIMHYGVKGRSGRKPGSGNKKSKKTVYKKKWQQQKIGGMFFSGKEKSGAAKVMAIINLKNVSDLYKSMALRKLFKSGIEIDEKELKKYFSKKPKLMQYYKDLRAGKTTKKNAVIGTNKPRINSATDAKRYRLQQLLKKRDKLMTEARISK